MLQPPALTFATSTTDLSTPPNHYGPVPVLVELRATPDFDHEVLEPLRAIQAQEATRVAEAKRLQEAAEAAQKALEAQAVTYTAPTYATTYSASGDVQAAIIRWANAYHVDPQWLLRVANCESGFNQNATNYSYSAGGGHPHGIFQFLPQTFYGNGGTNYDSYDDQARVAAYMFSIGQSGQWSCR